MTDNDSAKPKDPDPPRRTLPLVGLLLTMAILLYLAASWVQVTGRPAAGTSRLGMQGGWIVFRPIWLYPVTLLLGIIATVAGIIYLFASRLPSRASWRQLVRVQAEFTRHELDILCARRGRGRGCTEAICEATRKHLDAAEQAADPDECRKVSGMDQLIDVWTGASIEAAFRNLHAAEVAMVPLLSEEELRARIPEVLGRLTKCSSKDPRKRAAVKHLREAAERNLRDGVPVERLRAEYANALRYGYEVKDTEHIRVREFRNILLGVTAALWAVVAALCLVGASFPDATPLCFTPPPTTSVQQGVPSTTPRGQENTVCPSEEQPPGPRTTSRRLPAPGDVSLVALFGTMGGALSGAFALRKVHGQSTPFAVPVALSLLKLPSGALTAIVGILLVRGEFVPGLSQLDNQPQILAYAFFFGAAQQIATRFVDERAWEVLGRVPTNAPPSAADTAQEPASDPPEDQATSSTTAAQPRQRRLRRGR
jgi:hypothetical protein